MTSPREPDRLIRAFLDDGMDELPDRAYDEVRAEIEHTRQRFVFGPWRDQQMTRIAIFGIATAAIVLAVAVGIRFLPSSQGVGVGPPPSPSQAPSDAPTAAPTLSPTVQPTSGATPIADPQGQLEPGTYVAHPFDSILGMDARAFTFTVASDAWDAQSDPGQMIGISLHDEEIYGVALGFLKVHSLNSDACHWMTDEDIEIGPTSENLRTGLESSDQFDWRDPVMQAVPGEATAIEVVMPADLDMTDCDDGEYRIWNAEGMDIYAQGPSNLWQLSLLDVDGERYVVMGSSMPDTPDSVLDEMWNIFRSVQVDPEPGCPSSSHTCN